MQNFDRPIPDHTCCNDPQKAQDEIQIYVTLKVWTSSSRMLVQASRQNVGYPKTKDLVSRRRNVSQITLFRAQKNALPHHKCGNKLELPPYIDHVPSTFLSTRDHIVWHFAAQMNRVSGHNNLVNQYDGKGIKQ